MLRTTPLKDVSPGELEAFKRGSPAGSAAGTTGAAAGPGMISGTAVAPGDLAAARAAAVGPRGWSKPSRGGDPGRRQGEG